MWRAGRQRRAGRMAGSPTYSCNTSPNATTTAIRENDNAPIGKNADRSSFKAARVDDVLVQQSRVVGGAVPPAPSSAADRPLSRAPGREPGAAYLALSVGILLSGARPRPRPAKQAVGPPRRRHHAGRHAVRRAGRQPDPGADRRAGFRRNADRLDLDAG